MIDIKGFTVLKKPIEKGALKLMILDYHRRDSLTWRFLFHLYKRENKQDRGGWFRVGKIHQDRHYMWILQLPFNYELYYQGQPNMKLNDS